MQNQDKINPSFLNLDNDYTKLKENESPFIKDLELDINGNPNKGIGTDNPSGEGQNMLILKPSRSNKLFDKSILPSGYNKNIGNAESVTTQEEYYFNYNGNGKHGIYVIDGNTNNWYKVIEDKELNFSDSPEHFISEHRVQIRVIYNGDGTIKEKYLILTDGNGWQKYINVIAAIKTNGFDASIYPYWTLLPPHFDRRELLEYAVRPPMYKPEVRLIPNSESDKGKISNIIDKVFQFCFIFQNTDGRPTTSSPYSLPITISATEYLSNPDNIPKKIGVKMYAGSPLTEKILIYVRSPYIQKAEAGTSDIIPTWDNWYLYDTINKFSSCGDNDPLKIGNNYWLRKNQWENYSYDAIYNTIEYVFDNSKIAEIVDQNTINRPYNDIPIVSNAVTSIGDSVLLSHNKYLYNNLPCEVINSLDVQSIEGVLNGCILPSRKITLYAYIGRERANFQGTCDTSGRPDNSGYRADMWGSQVGIFVGTNTQMKFGGLELEANGSLSFHECESDYFKLNFADRTSFRCYLKGTPYSADGEWCWVDSSNNINKIDGLLDFSLDSTKQFIKSVLVQNGYFICRFNFNVPAGKYIAVLGRHNVANADNPYTQSTYITGIANSQTKYISTGDTGSGAPAPYPQTVINGMKNLVTTSKEMELDCTNGDLDTWGNGRDLFYVFCPSFGGRNHKNRWSFVEGYLLEERDGVPFEQFPYSMTIDPIDALGRITDRNGHFFGYASGGSNQQNSNIVFNGKMNCTYPSTFVFNQNRGGATWSRDNKVYFRDYNNGTVGDCNRMILKGKVTDTSGLTSYSNISVSIVDGSTAITRSDGTYELIIHNASNIPLVKNIYVNASGNFSIAGEDCKDIPLNQFNESLIPCIKCQTRTYPIAFDYKINIITDGQKSTKEGGRYSIGGYGADLAGRLQFVNLIKDVYVPSFLERNNLLPTFFRLLINKALKLNDYLPDIKWFTPCVSKNTALSKYVQWVGDKIEFLDNSGNVTDNTSTATFCKINIQSLYDYNISKNFTILAKYQFAPGDRVRVLDNGSGNLFDVATYGEGIDIQIEGTDYLQAAINAGLILPQTNTVLNNNNSTTEQNIGLIIKYDSKLDKLKDSKGFWIEIYTPSKMSDQKVFDEVAGFYPIINGEIADFNGYDSSGKPVYNYLTQIDLNYWDTYFLNRNISIPNVGNETFNHPFESPNVTDNFGANLSSGGRVNVKNDNAKQYWDKAGTIKSDDFNGFVNGLGTFRTENKKIFDQYPFGAIVATYTIRNMIIFICENDWFTCDYNMPYARVDNGSLVVVNLDNSLSQPRQKVGDIFGCSLEYTSSILFNDKYAFWCDDKNSAFVLCNYSSATDITRFDPDKGVQGFIQSYFNQKIKFIKEWNNKNTKEYRFDVVTGINLVTNNVFVTFRPRRNNTNVLTSYTNNRRNIQINFQETLVYDIKFNRWTRFNGFTPESYGKLRGKGIYTQFISYAAGKPYYHNFVGNTSFANYYGIQVTPCAIGVINKVQEVDKILQSLTIDSNDISWYIDLLYSSERNSFSYIPSNYFKKIENIFFSCILRDMNSYPNPVGEESFRCMLIDGKRLFGTYFVFRLVLDLEKLNDYTELKEIYYQVTSSPNNIINAGR